jgi:inhibitor of cysteine peptidase
MTRVFILAVLSLIYMKSVKEYNMMLNEQDSGRTVKVKSGAMITIRLVENPTTGYRWVVEARSGLEQVGDQNEPGSRIGAAGVRVLQFHSKSIGTHELRLKNWREREGESSVIGRFNAWIVVEEM